MLSSLVKKIMDPEGSMCYRNPNDRQRALGFRVSLPWASQLRPEAAHTWCTKSSTESLTAAQVHCRDVWSVPHTPHLTAGHCELWPLVFKKKETISWIAASYHCHSCPDLQEKEEMQKEPAPTTPASLSTCRSWYRHANLPRHIILRHRFTSVLTESITTRGCCYCVSAKGGSAWGQHSNVMQNRSRACPAAHRGAVVQPRALVTLLRLQVGMAPPAAAPSTQNQAHKNFCPTSERKHHSQLWICPPPLSQKRKKTICWRK